ncbi:deoxynucleoside kinase isoform X1 [Lutzomyia longipalpis]|nr:deoxynucleoside kinase isoform X1 [Lutzomyia longipalpis]
MRGTFCRFISRMASSGAKFCSEGQPFTVFIEGNIGSGKTTFLNHFQKYQDLVCLLTEPVEQWRNCGGVNLLDLMYKEPYRWAMPFQTYVTITMLNMHVQPTTKPVKLMERSMYSARYCFVENMMQSGMLHEGMYNILQEWYASIERMINVQADRIIYLRTDPEVAYERVRARARSEESCVPLEYLRQIHERYENWLIHGQHPCPAPVTVLNANLDLSNIGTEYVRSESSILEPIIQNTVRQPILASPSKQSKEAF